MEIKGSLPGSQEPACVWHYYDINVGSKQLLY